MASLNQLSLVIILSLSLLSTAQPPQSSPPPPPPPPQSLLNAAETLSNSGYNAMSLTLQLIIPTLSLPTTLTIFSPPDAAFSTAGQPSLSQLLLHFSPLSLSPSSLLSLPFSSTVPSLSPSKHLTITNNNNKSNSNNIISINSVGISQTPIFDDGFVLAYAIDNFFDLNFTIASNYVEKSDFQCLKLERVSVFTEASGVLKSRGYSIMASFLDLQLMGFYDHEGGVIIKWTVFAPEDGDLVQYSGDFLGYSALFLRHLLPCKVGWSDLDEMDNGTVVSKNVQGFSLVITKDEDDEMLMVNGVEITFPDMYDSEWLVIHGIRGLITLPEIEETENIVEESINE